MQEWIREHSDLLSWLTAGSAVMIAVMTVVVPVCIVRMPHDYFVCTRERGCTQSVARRRLLKIGRNFVAVLFILMGLSMVLLPGPGLITLAMGLLLLEFPGHDKLRRWVLGRKRVLLLMNWVRRRARCQPLTIPPALQVRTDRRAA